MVVYKRIFALSMACIILAPEARAGLEVEFEEIPAMKCKVYRVHHRRSPDKRAYMGPTLEQDPGTTARMDLSTGHIGIELKGVNEALNHKLSPRGANASVYDMNPQSSFQSLFEEVVGKRDTHSTGKLLSLSDPYEDSAPPRSAGENYHDQQITPFNGNAFETFEKSRTGKIFIEESDEEGKKEIQQIFKMAAELGNATRKVFAWTTVSPEKNKVAPREIMTLSFLVCEDDKLLSFKEARPNG